MLSVSLPAALTHYSQRAALGWCVSSWRSLSPALGPPGGPNWTTFNKVWFCFLSLSLLLMDPFSSSFELLHLFLDNAMHEGHHLVPRGNLSPSQDTRPCSCFTIDHRLAFSLWLTNLCRVPSQLQGVIRRSHPNSRRCHVMRLLEHFIHSVLHHDLLNRSVSFRWPTLHWRAFSRVVVFDMTPRKCVALLLQIPPQFERTVLALCQQVADVRGARLGRVSGHDRPTSSSWCGQEHLEGCGSQYRAGFPRRRSLQSSSGGVGV